MKILIISPSTMPTYCGVGKYADKIAESLEGTHQITILGQLNQRLKSNIEYSPKYKILLEDLSFNSRSIIISIIKEINPDIINIQYNSAETGKNTFLSVFPLLLKLNGVNSKIQITIHEFNNYTFKGKLRHYFPTLVANHVFCSDSKNLVSLTNFLNPFNLNIFNIKSKSSVISIGPQTGENIYTSDDSDYLLISHRVKENQIINIGFHGLIQPKNDLMSLLKVLSVIDDKNIKFHFHILGALSLIIDYGDYKDEVEDFQNEIKTYLTSNLIDKVTIHGDIDPRSREFTEIARNIDLFVIPDVDGVTVRRTSLWNVFIQSPALVVISKDKREDIDTTLTKFKSYDIQNEIEIIEIISSFDNNIDQFKSNFDFQQEYRKSFSKEGTKEYFEKVLIQN